jgi:hypothetical protein
MNVKGTYCITESMEQYSLEVDYEYYHKAPTHYDPFEDRLDIKEVRLNGMDITKFYWDYLNEDMFDEVYRYAYDNRYVKDE